MKAADLDAAGEIDATMATRSSCPDPCDPEAAWDSSHGPPFASGTGGSAIARSLWKVTYSCFKKVVKPPPPSPPPPPNNAGGVQPSPPPVQPLPPPPPSPEPTNDWPFPRHYPLGERLPAMPEPLQSDHRYRCPPQPTGGRIPRGSRKIGSNYKEGIAEVYFKVSPEIEALNQQRNALFAKLQECQRACDEPYEPMIPGSPATPAMGFRPAWLQFRVRWWQGSEIRRSAGL